jgi:hypothetical protein
MHEDKGTCIYCLKDSSNAKGSEHIIPDSLGYKDTLPKGWVCDECNNYFSDIDNSILHNRFIALLVGTKQIPGKKGKIRNQIGNKLSFPEKDHFSLESDTLIIESGKVKENYDITFSQDKVFNRFKFARGIHKIAFNLYVNNKDQKWALNPKFNNLRKYIRDADKNDFWKYGFKLKYNLTNSINVSFDNDTVRFNILDLRFFVSLSRMNKKIEDKAKNKGYDIVEIDQKWDGNSLLGLNLN